MKLGTKVIAYPTGGGEDDARVGFYLGETKKEGDKKDNIQIGDQVWPLTYREPADYDERGAGSTYRAA